MTDNEEKEVHMTAEQYIQNINELKKNTVSKTEYENILSENQKLANALLNGEEVTSKAAAEEQVDVNALRRDLFFGGLKNRDYWEKFLELRDYLLKHGEPDPIIPLGQKISPSVEDINAANRVASTIKQCIDYAQGDSQLFTNELNRITQDVRR